MDKESKIKTSTFRSTCAQVVATLAFNTLMVNVAMIIGMPVIVIGALRLQEQELHLSEEQASWFGGLIFMVQPLGSVISGFLQDLLGRKTCMMVVNIPELLGWLMLYFASSVNALFAGIIVLGLSIGFMEAPVLSYIGEISEPRLRGVLSTFGGIFINLGFILISFIGAITDWRTMVLLSSLAPVISFFLLALVPDSPAWLVSKGKVLQAQKAYQWLRGWVSPAAVQQELGALVAYVKETRIVKIVNSAEYAAVASNKGKAENEESQMKIFLHPSVQRPLRLITVYFFVSSCASLTAMRPFLIEVLTPMGLPLRPHIVIVIGGAMTLVGALGATVLMRRLGKRGLTFISLGLSIICCLGLGLYLALGLQAPWVPFFLFMTSFLFVPLGIMAVPWILISELFPLKGRGLAGGVTAAIGYLIMFLVIITYYRLVSLLQVSGTCFLYGLVGVAGFIYLYFSLPETEGVPLEEIEKLFSDQPERDSRRQSDQELSRVDAS